MIETGSGNPQGKAGTYRGFLLGSLRLAFLGGTRGFLCLHLCMDHLAPQSGADKNIQVREVIVKKKKRKIDLVLFFLAFPNYYLTSSGKIKNKGTIAREWPFCGVNPPTSMGRGHGELGSSLCQFPRLLPCHPRESCEWGCRHLCGEQNISGLYFPLKNAEKMWTLVKEADGKCRIFKGEMRKTSGKCR